MVLSDLFISLIVVTCQGNENQEELDVPDWEIEVEQVLQQSYWLKIFILIFSLLRTLVQL